MLIVDTGPLVAAADRSDRHHDQFREVIETDPGPFVTTAMVVAETAYLLDRQLGADAEIALVAIAERLKVARLATVDRTHFTVVRPNHVKAFDLVAPPA